MSSIVIRSVYSRFILLSHSSQPYCPESLFSNLSYVTAYLSFIVYVFDVTHLMAQTVCPILNAKVARFEVLSTFDEDSGLLGYYAVSTGK